MTVTDEKKRLIVGICIRVIIIASMLIVCLLCFYAHRVDENVGDPYVRDGDLVVGNRLDRNFEFGDTVIYEIDDVDHVGKIVALPNQSVRYGNGIVEVDGGLHALDEVKGVPETKMTVSSDSYFIVSDGVERSGVDSTACGGIKKDDIKAKCFWLFRCRSL